MILSTWSRKIYSGLQIVYYLLTKFISSAEVEISSTKLHTWMYFSEKSIYQGYLKYQFKKMCK